MAWKERRYLKSTRGDPTLAQAKKKAPGPEKQDVSLMAALSAK
jgi:hypothetical protein